MMDDHYRKMAENLDLSEMLVAGFGLTCYREPDYAEQTKKVADAFEQRFGERFPLIERSWGPPGQRLFVSGVRFYSDSLGLILDAMAWLRSTGAQFGVQVRTQIDGRLLARARWVSLLTAGDYVDQDKRTWRALNDYPVACSRCGAIDADRIPNPYRVSADVAKAEKRDIFKALNGIFVVRERVRNLFMQLVGDQIETGDVTSGRRVTGEPLSFIRPRDHIGPFHGQSEEDPCPACKRPTRVPRDQALVESELVTDFGPPELNIARVGRYPYSNSEDATSARPEIHEVVISGGLFAALYNRGVKGLVWPDRGAFISTRDDQPPFEQSRRFAHLYQGDKDKVLKYKLKLK